MDPLLRFLASAYNKILDTELSIYWKIFWGCIGIIFVLGVILTVYAKAKKLRGHKKATTTEPEQNPKSSKDMGSDNLPCCLRLDCSVFVPYRCELAVHMPA